MFTSSTAMLWVNLSYDHVMLMWQLSLLPMKIKFYTPLPLSAELLLKKLQQLFHDVTSCQNS